jgi:hypothetical protein
VYQGRRETSCQELSLIISALRQLSCPIHIPSTKHLAKQDWTVDWPTDRPTDRPIDRPTRVDGNGHPLACPRRTPARLRTRVFQNEAFRKRITWKTDFSNVIFFRNMSSFDTYYIYSFPRMFSK